MITKTPPYKKHSLSYSIMMYASMKRRTHITVDDVFFVFRKKAEKPSRVTRSLEMLCRNNLMAEIAKGKWRITPEGISMLWTASEPYHGEAGFTRKKS